MIDWVATLGARLEAGREVTIVTVVQTRGSAPREAGTRMLVSAATVDGTIGGGHLELEAIRIAREGLAARAKGSWVVRFPLAARLGQCCGGVATLAFQRTTRDDAWPRQLAARLACHSSAIMATPIDDATRRPVVVGTEAPPLQPEVADAVQALANARVGAAPLTAHQDGATYFVERVVAGDFHVVLFGNGHVGRALVQVLGALPCAVTWIDARAEDFPPVLPSNTSALATDAPEEAVADAAAGTMFLVMTHSHALDFELTAAILARGDFAYCGLIGSLAKRAQLERRMAARGIDEELVRRVTCPIGAPGLKAKDPGTIAVAVAAQLLALREARGAAMSNAPVAPSASISAA